MGNDFWVGFTLGHADRTEMFLRNAAELRVGDYMEFRRNSLSSKWAILRDVLLLRECSLEPVSS